MPPVSARFVFALRVIARHDRAAQDPFPFLAVRLGSLTVASLAIEFAQLCSRCWPEPIRVGAPCCQMLGYDETTLARMVAAASLCDRDEFSAEIDGLVRYDRHERLWQAAVRLAGADMA
ncbi:DNA-directed RNA polymerase subunit beta' [Altererythrobacter sp.]|uniref:DNA-directed RNA polymerase subunit beta' n=1 Tax=Altererythrobacter sp. TaxID=1872480 RepID=UPI003CFE2181